MVLVTGGAGFIGSHLTEALLGRGDRVVVLDDLSTGRAGNLDAALRHPACDLIVGSVLDAGLVDRLVAGADTVARLAAAVGVKLVLEGRRVPDTSKILGRSDDGRAGRSMTS
jgi:UDP-glucose 4-epimerase